MKYFYDLEFLEDGKTIEPISIGVVAEDGREYYAVFEEIAAGDTHARICAHHWLMNNVVPHLPLVRPGIVGLPGKPPEGRMHGSFELDQEDPCVLPRRVIRKQLLAFIRDDNALVSEGARAELWGYYSAYDHVALMYLWGPMVSKPAELPMFTHDIIQLAGHAGVGETWLETYVPRRPDEDAHDALGDARWNYRAWKALRDRVEDEKLGLHL